MMERNASDIFILYHSVSIQAYVLVCPWGCDRICPQLQPLRSPPVHIKGWPCPLPFFPSPSPSISSFLPFSLSLSTSLPVSVFPPSLCLSLLFCCSFTQRLVSPPFSHSLYPNKKSLLVSSLFVTLFKFTTTRS